jgi:Hypervirulence associated proteins TUDOR domain
LGSHAAIERFRAAAKPDIGTTAVTKTFRIGDHVSWNSEAGRVRGTIVKIHTSAVNYKGYIHHATADEPQYEIKSDKTDHIALHRGAVLRHIR